MPAILAWFQLHWPALLAVALVQLPSWIVAATKYPKVDGVLKVLLQILQIFSGLQHSNSPGTLKFPLTLAAPPVVLGSVVK
jgi:hypothetical protein